MLLCLNIIVKRNCATVVTYYLLIYYRKYFNFVEIDQRSQIEIHYTGHYEKGQKIN